MAEADLVEQWTQWGLEQTNLILYWAKDLTPFQWIVLGCLAVLILRYEEPKND